MIRITEPSLLYTENGFMSGWAVAHEAGVILRTGPVVELMKAWPEACHDVWTSMALIPGTVNAHNHCFQSLLRGLAVGRPFLEWRDKALYKISPALTPEDLYTGALFAFGEMMKCGVTTVADFFYVHNHGTEGDYAIIRAARDAGIRLVLARTMYDWEGAPAGYVESIAQAVRNTRMLAEEFNGRPDIMTTVVPAPHSLHAASLDMVRAGHQLAKELGTRYHIHVAEEPFEVDEMLEKHGKRPVELLDAIGVLDESTVMVHAVWLTEDEKERMAARGASLAYCPSSNMFLADGVTDISTMLAAGVNIGLGSDGACSNNRISVFEEMRMASLLQKVSKLNALLVSTEQAFAMGTKNGGRLLELPVGEIREGYRADFVGLDLNDMSLHPRYSDNEQLLPNIVYSMQPTAIRRVVVNGEDTVRDGQLTKVTEKVILDRVCSLMARLEKECR